MKYYAGLDVSLKETAVCIVDQNGEIVKEGSVFTEPEDICRFLQTAGVQFDRVGLEAGSLSPWLCHSLTAMGLPVVCMETYHAKAALQAQKVKTDRNDARGLAHIMRTGWFKAVHVKSDQSQKLRVLLKNRRCLVEKRVDLENQIRGTLKVFGLKTGQITALGYEGRIRELIDGDRDLELYVIPMLLVRQAVLEQQRKLDKLVRDVVKEDAVCRRLMTIPGVGALTALGFKTSIDNPYRFKKSRHVGSHLGLTPRKYASGEIDYDGQITKCGDALARSSLYEAAIVLMCRSKKWSALKAWGMKIARRSSMKNACVAVARKLAVIMHRMWIDGTDFQWGREPAAAMVAMGCAA
jgi:transposase